MLIAMALIDLEHYILPPQLTFGAILVTYIPLSLRQLYPGSGASPAAFQTALFLNGLLLLGILGIWIRGIPRRMGAFLRAVGFACAPAGGMLAKQFPDAAKLCWFAIGVAILLALKMYPDDDGSEIEESGEPEVEELGRGEALKCIGVAVAALIAFVAFWIVIGVETTQLTYLNFDSLPSVFKEFIQAVVVSDPISGMMLSWLLLIAFSYGVTGLLGKVAMGGGDLALMASVGAAVGLGGTLQTLLLACVWGILTYVLLRVFFGRRLSRPIPFGPFLVAGVVTVIFTREWAIEEYLSWLGLV
jgi:prepilin signal peptidase PulO-like enzyme (type II secretory pathway)